MKRGITEIERLLGVAPQERRDRVVETTGIPGVRVRVTPLRNVGWCIDIANERGVVLHVRWDDSSYVNTDGYSTGRLIRNPQRRSVTVVDDAFPGLSQHAHVSTQYVVDIPAQQAPTPVPASAKLAEYCVPESQANLVIGRRVLPSGGGDGVLRLVFGTPDGTETWTGAVTFADRR